MLTPAPGSKSFEDNFTSGLAYESVDGVSVEPHMTSGMHVIASSHSRPWMRQFNLLTAYVYFFNPLRLLWALVFPKTKIPLVDADTSPAVGASRAGKRPRVLRHLMRRLSRKARAHLGDAAVQTFGMWGLGYTFRATFRWTWHLMRGGIQRHSRAPMSRLPMRGVDGGRASHALPETPTPITVPLPAEGKKAA